MQGGAAAVDGVEIGNGGRPASSPICARLHAHLADGHRGVPRVHRRAVRQGRAAGEAELLRQPRPARGRARGDPADGRDAVAGEGRAAPAARAGQAVRPHLAPLRRLPDAPRSLLHRCRRRRSRPAGGGKTYRLRASASRLVEPGWLASTARRPTATRRGPRSGGPQAGRRGPPRRRATATRTRGRGRGGAGCPRLHQDEALGLVPRASRATRSSPAPARFTEGSLVREMEELGIGRPSTYASIVSTILQRRYVHKLDQKLAPTDLGEMVNDRLTRHFRGSSTRSSPRGWRRISTASSPRKSTGTPCCPSSTGRSMGTSSAR